MMWNNDLKIKEFDYELPNTHIAFFPMEERDASKLLVYNQGNISETVFKNLASQLPPNAHLIFNDTRVIEARLYFTTASGARIEIFCLEPADTDISTALTTQSALRYKCLIGKASKWKKEEALKRTENGITLTAAKIEKVEDAFLVEFTWNKPLAFIEVLHLFGRMPLPPYIKRTTETSDAASYQTVYAKADGSVAAPTAGLHFTEAVFSSLHQKGISTDFVTLHVGAGTFMPVKTEKVADHNMHAELIEVRLDFLEKMLQQKNILRVAVGTTSLRTLESLYWLGYQVKTNAAFTPETLDVSQWLPYQNRNAVSAQAAIESLVLWMKKHQLTTFYTKTRLLIMPGYQFKTVGALITNFHQPGSTLLLLIAAITGNDWKKIYDYALQHNFRFLSYGDSSLLFLQPPTL